MVGIPRFLNTKKDVGNIHEMVKQNLLPRAEWINKLNSISERTSYQIPVLEKTADYIIVPDSELITEFYGDIVEVVEADENKKVFKVYVEDFKSDYVNIPGRYLELERLGITLEEINRMIEEVR